MGFITKSLKGLILGIISFGILFVSITAIIAVLLLGNNLQEYEVLVSETVDHGLASAEITVLFKEQVQEWKNVLLRGREQAKLNKYWDKFEDRHREIQDKGRELSGHLAGMSEGRVLDDFLRAHKSIYSQYRAGKDAFIASGFDQQVGDGVVEGIDREPTKLLMELSDMISGKVRAESKVILSESKTLMLATEVIIPLVALVLIAMMFLVITQRFTRPLAELMVHVDRFGNGDFSVAIKMDRNDEIGEIARQLGSAQKSLGGLLTKVKSAAEKVNESAQNMKQNSAEISRGMQSANSRIEQSATAVTEMAATVQEVSRNAAHAAESASRADVSAHDGARLMQETIKTIDILSSEVQKASDVIRKLEDETKNIGTVLDVIRGIAEQTNLLALNAAIEAARAGEQGRGFAVVADEVRSLAQRTQESTTEIQQIIETVQSGAKDAVMAMEQGSQATHICVEQANTAGHSLQEITSTVNDIHMMNSQIATAAEEQTTVSEDISQNINGISSFICEVQGSINQFDDLSKSLVVMADELRQVTSVIRL